MRLARMCFAGRAEEQAKGRIRQQARLLAGFGTLLLGLSALAGLAGLAGSAQAESLNDVVRKPMPHSSLPRMHADYSMFHFVPRGDEVSTQPERGRLFFRKKTGQPDGYAEHRGAVIFYYDPTGKPIRIQRLTPEELTRMTQ